MHYTFTTTRRFPLFGLFPGDTLTISDEHPDYFLVERRLPANFGGVLGGLLGGELEDTSPERTAEETQELIRLVAGLPQPRLPRPRLRLV